MPFSVGLGPWPVAADGHCGLVWRYAQRVGPARTGASCKLGPSVPCLGGAEQGFLRQPHRHSIELPGRPAKPQGGLKSVSIEAGQGQRGGLKVARLIQSGTDAMGKGQASQKSRKGKEGGISTEPSAPPQHWAGLVLNDRYHPSTCWMISRKDHPTADGRSSPRSFMEKGTRASPSSS